MRAIALLGACLCQLALSQPLPAIAPGGIVNAASYAQPVSPGAIVAIFGTNLAAATASAPGTPLPLMLAGTSVTVNGIQAPLFFVSPTQINIQIPWSTTFSYLNYTQITAIVTTAAGASAPAQAPLFEAAGALFTADSSGCGQASALNIAPDGTVSVNSPSNSAAPGDFIALYGTGLGLPYAPVVDGSPATMADTLQTANGVLLDGQALPYTFYDGLAPGLVAVDQINFQIPAGTREGCAIPVAVWSSLLTPALSVSIHSGRGQCDDPPPQSYGVVTLTKTVSTGTSNDGDVEQLTASFPSGPGATMPKPPSTTPDFYYANEMTPVAIPASCPANGQTQLSAGTISVQAPLAPQPVLTPPAHAAGGFTYQQALPDGFIGPGQYAVSASGAAAAFQGTLAVPPPIQILTPLPPGTQIPSNQGFTVKWTGGSGMLVKISIVVPEGISSAYSYGVANGSDGSFTFTPGCSGNPEPMGEGVFCYFGIPLGKSSVVVEASPAQPAIVNAAGLSQGVQLTWLYRWVFGGVVFN